MDVTLVWLPRCTGRGKAHRLGPWRPQYYARCDSPLALLGDKGLINRGLAGSRGLSILYSGPELAMMG